MPRFGVIGEGRPRSLVTIIGVGSIGAE